jgi:hypothetical protein
MATGTWSASAGPQSARVFKEGYVFKLGGAKGGFQTWRERWMILKEEVCFGFSVLIFFKIYGPYAHPHARVSTITSPTRRWSYSVLCHWWATHKFWSPPLGLMLTSVLSAKLNLVCSNANIIAGTPAFASSSIVECYFYAETDCYEQKLWKCILWNMLGKGSVDSGMRNGQAIFK